MSIATFTKIIYLKNVFKHISHCFGGRGHTCLLYFYIFSKRFMLADFCQVLASSSLQKENCPSKVLDMLCSEDAEE